MKSDTHMRQFRRPEFMESWIGKGLLATVIAGAAIGIMLPLPLRDARRGPGYHPDGILPDNPA